MLRSLIIFGLVAASAAGVSGQEGRMHADFRGEATRFSESCGTFTVKAVPSCAELLFTDHPIHIAVGSIAPQNGFAGGVAMVGHWTPNESWRTSWNTDGVASGNSSWRAGMYFKAIHTPVVKITPVVTSSAPPAHSKLAVHPETVFNLYAQSLTLHRLYFYGLGQDALKAEATVFGMRQTVVGTNVIAPVLPRISISLLGEINGRFVSLNGNHDEDVPSIEQVFTEQSAPGLTSQPSTIQLGEGVRFEPHLFNDHLQIDYLAQFQQFLSFSNSPYTFRRLNFDLDHVVPLYKNSRSYGPRASNGPDECGLSAATFNCPSITRNREGSVEVRLRIAESIASAGNAVPIYFQPTLGGSDINGDAWLSSYHDYRFRGPDAIVLREGIEHSIWGPLGAVFTADQGRVALARGDVSFNHLAHSFSAGLTVKAGGLPALSLTFAWGGGEGTHTSATVNTSLLGGSARPSQF